MHFLLLLTNNCFLSSPYAIYHVSSVKIASISENFIFSPASPAAYPLNLRSIPLLVTQRNLTSDQVNINRFTFIKTWSCLILKICSRLVEVGNKTIILCFDIDGDLDYYQLQLRSRLKYTHVTLYINKINICLIIKNILLVYNFFEQFWCN